MLYLIAFVFLAATLAIYYHDRQRDKGLPLGPPRVPLIGNIPQLPQENPWRTYAAWSAQYGPIFSLRVGLDTIIMLGNHTAARDPARQAQQHLLVAAPAGHGRRVREQGPAHTTHAVRAAVARPPAAAGQFPQRAREPVVHGAAGPREQADGL